ncbi:hypothetical protein FLL83_10610 [Vibrio cholerae]|uniref:ABC-three component system middle component 7 n=1 Tax=Vibrio cholerae TaxID=666 RepID=UPI000BA94C00|nr:ABC-three component system middle component 7 [Vibrio cholerae]EGR4176547.1 hypothetical protein [Vibrio cholerae]PAR96893.1 hypothetical protein CGT81_13170 [Vibrio cholerae]TQP19189.1 hypothetical protein FLM04_17180 [Vibrio cholerae]TQQ63155.1 hypothetical protein FLL83_10610 [Vibrio cholerae]
MIVPNKSIRFKDSIMFKMLCILDLEFDEIEVSDLYKKIKKHFDCIDEFVYSLDLLYILDKIKVTDSGKVIKC